MTGGHAEPALYSVPLLFREVLMGRMTRDLLKSDTGVTTIEYAIIASLLAMGLVVSLSNIGDRLAGLYRTVVGLFP
jgi:Flp pilus assembly pilin Flp